MAVAAHVGHRHAHRLGVNGYVGRAAEAADPVAQPHRNRVAAVVGGKDIELAILVHVGDRCRHTRWRAAHRDVRCRREVEQAGHVQRSAVEFEAGDGEARVVLPVRDRIGEGRTPFPVEAGIGGGCAVAQGQPRRARDSDGRFRLQREGDGVARLQRAGTARRRDDASRLVQVGHVGRRVRQRHDSSPRLRRIARPPFVQVRGRLHIGSQCNARPWGDMGSSAPCLLGRPSLLRIIRLF